MFAHVASVGVTPWPGGGDWRTGGLEDWRTEDNILTGVWSLLDGGAIVLLRCIVCSAGQAQ